MKWAEALYIIPCMDIFDIFVEAMKWMTIAILAMSLAVALIVMIPESLKSGELTWKRLIWGGLAISAFAVFRAFFIDRYLPDWLNDIIGHM